MSITEKEIRHIAKLSAIAIRDEELPELKKNIGDILDYFDKLSSLDTEGVTPTCHVHGNSNAFREDVVDDSFSLEDIEKNAPDYVSAGFRVPKVI